jgi:hypothetical protein
MSFVTNRDDNDEIYVMNANGSGQLNVSLRDEPSGRRSETRLTRSLNKALPRGSIGRCKRRGFRNVLRSREGFLPGCKCAEA